MLNFAVPPRQRQTSVSNATHTELSDALAEEAAQLKDEARALLKRRRELLSWREGLLHGQSEPVAAEIVV